MRRGYGSSLLRFVKKRRASRQGEFGTRRFLFTWGFSFRRQTVPSFAISPKLIQNQWHQSNALPYQYTLPSFVLMSLKPCLSQQAGSPLAVTRLCICTEARSAALRSKRGCAVCLGRWFSDKALLRSAWPSSPISCAWSPLVSTHDSDRQTLSLCPWLRHHSLSLLLAVARSVVL